MRKLISFALFAFIVLLLLAAKSADAQVVVKARVVPHLRHCPRAGYYGFRMYRPRVIGPVAYIPARAVIHARRIY